LSRVRQAARAPAAKPSVLKPMRLITAGVGRQAETSGASGLPRCASGVRVPTSTNGKPSPSSASGTSASLSNPAARPSGWGNPQSRRVDGQPGVSRSRGRAGRGTSSAAIARPMGDFGRQPREQPSEKARRARRSFRQGFRTDAVRLPQWQRSRPRFTAVSGKSRRGGGTEAPPREGSHRSCSPKHRRRIATSVSPPDPRTTSGRSRRLRGRGEWIYRPRDRTPAPAKTRSPRPRATRSNSRS